MIKTIKQKVITNACHVFCIRGIQSSTMHDIAIASCISPKQLSESFENKKAIVEGIVTHLCERNQRYILVNPNLSPNGLSELKNFLEFIKNEFLEMKPSLIREMKKYYGEAWNGLVALKEEQLIPYMNKNIQRGMNEGIFCQLEMPDTLGSIYFIMLCEIMEDPIQGLEQGKAMDILNTIFVRGILSVKGIGMLDVKLNPNPAKKMSRIKSY